MAKQKAYSLVNLFIAFSAASLVFLAGLFPPFEAMDRRFLDLSFRIRGAELPHPDIVIIDIDDQSLVKMGSWPWPRSHHADLLEILTAHRPSVVFYDILFSETSDAGEDLRFAEAVRKNGNVVLPFYFASDQPKDFTEDKAVFPISSLREAARGMGFVNVIPDSDGHVRQIIPNVSGYDHASLVIATLHRRAQSGKWDKLLPGNELWINFPGPYETFRKISFDRLIEEYERPDVQAFLKSLEGKIVLVGYTAAGTALDLKPTAFSSQYPGIALQASALYTFLTQAFIFQPPRYLYFLLLFVFALLIIQVTSVTSPLKGLFYAAASLILLFEIFQLVFKHVLLWIPFFGFLVLASGLFLAILLIQFVRVRIEREIFSRELALASRIQKNLLPAEIPRIAGLEITAYSLPARHVGGDFYDVVPLPDGKWGICVGDVSGKGIPAALFMAKAISEFRREADSSSPGAVVKRLNAKTAGGGFGGLFFTLLYLVADPRARKFSYSNGGHEPILLYRSHNRSVEELSTHGGIPLGIDPSRDFGEGDVAVAAGDVLLLQSDGVKEALNSRREMFGMERIKSVLVDSGPLNAQAIINQLLENVKAFVRDAPQHDDMTILCAKFS